ncbi:MAG: cytochrome D ubiquinol oxidase subunit II, partial [Chthoniobacterales bacterium]
FHSYRWVGERLVIRLQEQLSERAVAKLNQDFADLLENEPLHRAKPLKQERNEPELQSLPRLVGGPHRRNFGRMRQLIDAINRAETE